MKSTYVLYHANCPDGFGAAFAAWLKLGDKAAYLPVQYGKPVPSIPEGSEVYILDFCYDKDTLLKLYERMMKVVVIDHHKTNIATLEDLEQNTPIECYFDQSKSGAVMAWEHFHPTTYFVPQFFKYIQDRDLWKFEMAMSKEFSAGLASHPQEFETWKRILDSMTTVSQCHIFSEGVVVLRHINQMVDAQARKAVLKTFEAGDRTWTVPVVNAPLYHSEIGHRLLELFPDAPFAATFFLRLEDEQFVWSLRSEDHREDVAAIAKLFPGGGGHRNAAGFQAGLVHIKE